MVTLDATKSGKYGGENNSIIVKVINNKISMRIVVDTNLIEIYLNEGQASLFALAYPEPDNINMEFHVKNGITHIDDFEIFSLRTIWGKEKRSIINPFVMMFLSILICGTTYIKKLWR